MTTKTSPTAKELSSPNGLTPSGPQDNRQARDGSTPNVHSPAGVDLPAGQTGADAQRAFASGGQTTQPTISNSVPRSAPSAGSDLRSGQPRLDAHASPAAADHHFPDGQEVGADHHVAAVGEHNSPAPANGRSTTKMHSPVLAPNSRADLVADDAQDSAVGTGSTPPATKVIATPKCDSSLADPLLALLADVLDDLERTRIANENRLRQLTRDEFDSDGEERGFGLTLDQPQVAALANVVEALGKLEHDSTLNLQRALRKHPLGPWVKSTIGVGEKQGARLIAAIGDPYWNTLHDRPRTVSELWAYAGLHVIKLPADHRPLDAHTAAVGGGKQGDPDQLKCVDQTATVGVAPTRARGQRANWSSTAKMRAYLVAESCIRQARSPYRAVYETGRTKYEDAIHQAPCRRCGPKGKPADVGTPISAGHQHARAMRLVMKAILRDLWIEAKRIHGEATP